MTEPKQPANDKKPQTPENTDPKTFNTTPRLNPDIDYINRTLP